MRAMHFRIAFLASCFLSVTAYGSDIEQVVSQYRDGSSQQLTSSTKASTKMNLTEKTSQVFSLGFTRAFIHNDDALKPEDRAYTLETRQLGWSLSHNTQTLSLSGTQQQSGRTNTKSWSANYGFWFNENTLQLTLGMARSDSHNPGTAKYDRNADVLFLPTEITGKTYSLGLIQLATPTTIILTNYAYTQRSDRPDAQLGSVEWRESWNQIHSSTHLQASIFKNRGMAERTTDYGSLNAYAIKGIWHYTLPTEEKHAIVALGARYYHEQENIDEFFWDRALISRLYFSQLRYRFGEGPWTDVRNEVFATFGKYLTDEPRAGQFVAIGGLYNF